MKNKIHKISRTFNLILILLVSLVFTYYSLNSNNSDTKNLNNLTNQTNFFDNKEKVELIKVIDGDTLLVRSNKEEFKVRLIGIDTPESSYNKKLIRDSQKTSKNTQEILEMGRKSKEFTKKLVSSSKYLYLEYDVQTYDKYNRKLAYVYLDNKEMLNYILIREGYAKVYTFPPNVKYQEKFVEAQKLAQQQKKGLWKGSE
ncbi:MAG: thermonuclease family protein [bacterium]